MTGWEKFALSCTRRGLVCVLAEKKFTEKDVKYWNRFLREVVKSSSPEVFQKCVDMILEDIVYLRFNGECGLLVLVLG